MQRAQLEELKEKVAVANRVLYHQGLAEWLGHASLRLPGTDHVMVKRNGRLGVCLGYTTAREIVTMDLEGRKLEGEGEPPAEWPLHTEIYKARSDVGSVIHTHQKWATAFGIAGRDILPLYPNPWHTAFLAEPIPIFDSARFAEYLVTTPEVGRAVAQTMGQHTVCHLVGHGVVVAAPTMEQCVVLAVDLERQAEMTYLTSQLGTPRAIPKGLMTRDPFEATGALRQWEYYAKAAPLLKE